MGLITFLAICIAAVAAVPSNPQRIVGGATTTITQYPQIVSLLFSHNLIHYGQACAGIIVNNRSILTAAHCISGNAANRWRGRVGSTFANSGGVVHNAIQLIVYPRYIAATANNDIGIMRVNNIIFNNNVQQARYANANYVLHDGQPVWAAGWGLTSFGGQPSETLRHVQMWTVNQNTCRTRYASIGFSVSDTMLCAGWLDVGGRGQCHGDSGGPLYHNGVIVGVCSWGYNCAHRLYPSVNARVSRFISWIIANA